MKNNLPSGAPAIDGPEDTLTILREVSEVYETLREIRRRAAKIAHDNGATYQALGDAMGTTRSTAHTLLNRRAA